MWPLLPDRSLIRVRRQPCKLGDIVVRPTESGDVQVHRVVGRRAGRVRTRGDALTRGDGEIAEAALLGVVMVRATRCGWLRLDRVPCRALGLVAGWLAPRLLTPARRALAALWRRRTRSRV